jgi:hypothetical protein
MCNTPSLNLSHTHTHTPWHHTHLAIECRLTGQSTLSSLKTGSASRKTLRACSFCVILLHLVSAESASTPIYPAGMFYQFHLLTRFCCGKDGPSECVDVNCTFCPAFNLPSRFPGGVFAQHTQHTLSSAKLVDVQKTSDIHVPLQRSIHLCFCS